MEKQLELNNIPRKRVLLHDAMPQAAIAGEVVKETEQGVEVHVQLPSCPPTQAVAELWLGYTPWIECAKELPPVAGNWDFTSDEYGENGLVTDRKFFDPASGEKAPGLHWRGLTQAWPESFNPCLNKTNYAKVPYYQQKPIAGIVNRRRLLND